MGYWTAHSALKATLSARNYKLILANIVVSYDREERAPTSTSKAIPMLTNDIAMYRKKIFVDVLFYLYRNKEG